MNRKQLACVIIGLAMALMIYLTTNMKGKLAAMQAEESAAESAAVGASSQRQAMEARLANLKRDTDGVRVYLDHWASHFEQTESQELAELRLSERIKQGGLVLLNQRFQVVGNPGGGYITKNLRAHLTIEDDYVQCMQWLGSMEENLPACRVSSCKLSKGQNANDVKMELVIDIPITGTTETKTT